MATNTLTMDFIVRKFKNARSSANNRWFAYAKSKGVLSTRGLAQHMKEHGVVGNRADIENLLIRLSECIPELVAQGYSVKLNSIGIFYPIIKNVKGGAETPADFNVALNIKGVKFAFKADSTDLDDLTTKTFGKKVVFNQGYYQEQSGAKAPLIPLEAAEEPEP